MVATCLITCLSNNTSLLAVTCSCKNKAGWPFWFLTGMWIFQPRTVHRETNSGKPQVKIRLAFHLVGRRVNKHVTWLSDDDVLFRFRAQQRAKYSYYSSRPAVSQLYGISDTMWNCFGNQKPQRRQIVKRFNKMEQNDISLRLCQVLVSKEFDAYLPIETGRNKPSYPRGIYFSFIQAAGHFGIWGKLKANWELNESHELNSEYYWMCYIK